MKKLTCFKSTIIPDVTEQLESIQRLLDAMILATGGESGRDFTEIEREAWEALLRSRHALQTVEHCLNAEVI